MASNSKTNADPKIPNLVYVSDEEPGLSRIKRGKGFQYLLPDGTPLRDRDELERIKKLGLPPAYSDVWICMKPHGHIQATGIDSVSRKQYRYHDDWRAFRDQQKFEQLAEFANVLPRIRRKVNALLKSAKKADVFGKEVATAALVRLMDRTAIRIGGNSGTARGATTLDMKNVKYVNHTIRLRYRAKGGKRVQCSLRDTRLQKTLEVIDDLPGKRLFQYIGADGEVHPLDSGDVNAWLKRVSGTETVSAKMFRTWHGSVAAMEAICRSEKPTIKLACEAAAEILRNTPAICRSSYVHPAVLELIEMGTEDRKALVERGKTSAVNLSAAENRFVGLITCSSSGQL